MSILDHLHYDLITAIRNQFYIWNNNAKIRRAKYYADFLSEQNNGRLYVVMRDHDGSLAIMNKDEFLLKKRRGVFAKQCTWHDVTEKPMYKTKQKTT